MINLQPIHEKIRRELHKRQKVLNREGILFEGPQSDGTGNQTANANNIFSKSTWVRMLSPGSTFDMTKTADMNITEGKLNIAALGGGLLKDDGSMYFGYDDLYNSPRNTGEGKYRPIPGVKSISVEYKDTMSALRTATINWTCWSFEDIEKLQSFFLKHGKSVVLEWGFSYEKSDIILMNPEDLNFKTIHRKFAEKALNSGGTYDGMMGVITNWEWSVRDDGGADCVTTISSVGIDILKQQLTPVDDISVSETETHGNPDNETGGKQLSATLTFAKFIESVEPKISKIFGPRGPGSKRQPDSWHGVGSNVAYFENELYMTWGWIEDNILSRYLSKLSRGGDIINSIRSIEPVLSPDGDHLKLHEMGDLDSKYSGDELISVKKLIKGTGDSIDSPKAYMSTEISNHDDLISPNFKFFILPGQLKKTDEDISSTVHPILYAANSSKFSKFKNDNKKGSSVNNNSDQKSEQKSGNLKFGYLRNILFNWNYLSTHIFDDVDNLDTALNKLFQNMNEQVGIWDFEMVASPDDLSRMKIIDRNSTKYNIDDLLNSKSKLQPDWSKASGLLFEFPLMSRNSIVSGQSLNSKIPSSMAVATMYGNTNAVVPASAGGMKSIAIAAIDNDSNDALLEDLSPGYWWPKFGNGTGLANDDISNDGGIWFNVIKSKSSDTKEAEEDAEGNSHLIEDLKFTKNQQAAFKEGRLDNIRDNSVYARSGILKNGEKALYRDIMKYTIGHDPQYSVLYDSSPMVPIELSLTIDGISGLFPGNCFTSDYIPKQYKKHAVFQIFTSTQELDANGWKSIINGKMRIHMKEFTPPFKDEHKDKPAKEIKEDVVVKAEAEKDGSSQKSYGGGVGNGTVWKQNQETKNSDGTTIGQTK